MWIKPLGKQKLQFLAHPQAVKSRLAAVGKSNVSRVKLSPGPALPGAGSGMDLPALKHRMSTESNLLLCLKEHHHRQRFLPMTSTKGINSKDASLVTISSHPNPQWDEWGLLQV